MPRKIGDVEWHHGHCADVLMGDYGIRKELRREVCREIDKIYMQRTMIHCTIIASVRGWEPDPVTDELKKYLSEHQRHPPKNHRA